MELGKTTSRDFYIDVVENEGELKEIYLFIVDHKADKTFKLTEKTLDGEDRMQEFLDTFLAMRRSGIATHYFAVNAKEVMKLLVKPLKETSGKAKQAFTEERDSKLPGEWLTDCISMGRAVPMTSFDERPELGAAFRRRLKEKYHSVSEEVKRVKSTHVFLDYSRPSSGPELSVRVTDAFMNTIEETKLFGRIEDDIMVLKLSEILKKYPEADIITNRTSDRMYALVDAALLANGKEPEPVIYSVNSMLHALGKSDIQASPDAYRDYIMVAEELRFGRYEDDEVFGVHVLKLPFRYNSEKAWKKNFKKNQLWRRGNSEDEYFLMGDDRENDKEKKSKKEEPQTVVGRYTVEKGNEKFVLKIERVSVKKYIRGFAVLTIWLENHFYPGERDIRRINSLSSALWASSYADDELPDVLSIQMKTDTKTYSLEAVKRKAAGIEPWLGLLLTMGRKKSNSKRRYFGSATLSENSYTYYNDGTVSLYGEDFDEASEKALIAGEYLLNIERELAYALEPENDKKTGILSLSRKRQVKRLAGEFAYMTASYVYDEEHSAFSEAFRNVYRIRKGIETEERLNTKFARIYRRFA